MSEDTPGDPIEVGIVWAAAWVICVREGNDVGELAWAAKMGLRAAAAKDDPMEGNIMDGFVSRFNGVSLKKLLKDFISDCLGVVDNKAFKVLFDEGEAGAGGVVVIGSTRLILKDIEVVGKGLIVGVPVVRSMEGSLVAG